MEEGKKWLMERYAKCNTNEERRNVRRIVDAKTVRRTEKHRTDIAEALADVSMHKGVPMTVVVETLLTKSLRDLGEDVSDSMFFYKYELEEWFGMK